MMIDWYQKLPATIKIVLSAFVGLHLIGEKLFNIPAMTTLRVFPQPCFDTNFCDYLLDDSLTHTHSLSLSRTHINISALGVIGWLYIKDTKDKTPPFKAKLK